MKFLLIGDRHNSELKPQSRIDDFYETVKNKDDEILRIARNNNVTAIIQAGDFWTDSDSKLKNDFITDVVKRWINPLNPSESIPMIGVAGNHDLIGGNIKSLPNTTLGLISELGFMKLATKTNPIIYRLENGKTVAITGTNYHINMDKPEYIDDYIVDNKLGDYHIHVVHGMLSPKNLGKIIKHTTIDAIKHTKADITFCGHDHIGFPTVCVDNKYFINPGAIVRLKNDVKELTREVKVVLLTIDDSGISLEEIPLSSAIDSKFVLSREIVEQKKEKEAAAEKMKSEIKKLEIAQNTRFSEILDDIFTRDKVPEAITDDLKRRITEKEILNNNHLSVPKNVWITDVIIDNFQSHEHSEISFSNGFNVLLGESRQGKTAIMRAIRWVLENKPTGNSMIRHGAEKASVTIKIADGTIITRFIGKKENGYRVVFPSGDVQEGNTNMVGTVQSLCGFNDMKIQNDFSVPINFLRQGTGWFLIDDDTPSSKRARILGSLQNTQSADAIVKDLDKENLQINANIKSNNVQIDKAIEEIKVVTEERDKLEKIKYLLEKIYLKQKIQEYLALKKKSEKIEELVITLSAKYERIQQDNLLSRIKAFIEKRDLISSETKKISEQKVILSTATQKIETLDKALSKQSLIIAAKNKLLLHNEISNAFSVVKTESKRQVKIDRMMSRLNGCNDSLIKEIKSHLDKYNAIYDATLSVRKEKKKSAAADRFITASNGIFETTDLIFKIKSLLDKKDSINKELKSVNEQKANVDKFNSQIKTLEKEEFSIKENKAKLLSEAKICPICAQTITSDVTNKIIGECSHDK